MAMIALPFCTLSRFTRRFLLPGHDLHWIIFRLCHRDLVRYFIVFLFDSDLRWDGSVDLAFFAFRSQRSRRGSVRFDRSRDRVPRIEV